MRSRASSRRHSWSFLFREGPVVSLVLTICHLSYHHTSLSFDFSHERDEILTSVLVIGHVNIVGDLQVGPTPKVEPHLQHCHRSIMSHHDSPEFWVPSPSRCWIYPQDGFSHRFTVTILRLSLVFHVKCPWLDPFGHCTGLRRALSGDHAGSWYPPAIPPLSGRHIPTIACHL